MLTEKGRELLKREEGAWREMVDKRRDRRWQSPKGRGGQRQRGRGAGQREEG